jgi:hypothetical protein
LGNTLCHIDPDKYEIVFENIRILLGKKDTKEENPQKKSKLLIVELRDGDKMKEWLKSTGYKFDVDRHCAYERRAIIQEKGKGGDQKEYIKCSFFRYIQKDERTYTSDGYLVTMSDDKDFYDREEEVQGTIQSVPSMEVAYVFPHEVRKAMIHAGFRVVQISNYQSMLKHGIFLMGMI